MMLSNKGHQAKTVKDLFCTKKNMKSGGRKKAVQLTAFIEIWGAHMNLRVRSFFLRSISNTNYIN
jgi:hypothetical protein